MKKILLTLLLVLSLVTSAYAITIPHAFYGTASFSGGLAADGTVITAKLNGNTVDTATVQDGKYGYGDDALIVADDEEQGGTITFHIVDAAADQEVTFQTGEVTELNLTFPGNAPPPDTIVAGNNANSTDTGQTVNPPGGDEGSSGSGDSGGSSSGGGGGGGGGGSSGGSSGRSRSSNEDDDEPSPLLFEETESSDDVSNSFKDSQAAGLLNSASNSEENPSGFANLLTGAFTGVFSKTSGKLIFVAAVFILVLLCLSLVRHFKKKKK